MCFPEPNQQPILGVSLFPVIKVAMFIGRETKTHILPTKITKIAKVNLSNQTYSFRIINHSTTKQPKQPNNQTTHNQTTHNQQHTTNNTQHTTTTTTTTTTTQVVTQALPWFASYLFVEDFMWVAVELHTQRVPRGGGESDASVCT